MRGHGGSPDISTRIHFPHMLGAFWIWNRSHAPELEKNGTCRKVRRTILLISLEANLQKKRADLSERLVAIKRFCGIPRSFCTWMIKLQGLEELFQKAQDYLTSQFAAYWKTWSAPGTPWHTDALLWHTALAHCFGTLLWHTALAHCLPLLAVNLLLTGCSSQHIVCCGLKGWVPQGREIWWNLMLVVLYQQLPTVDSNPTIFPCCVATTLHRLWPGGKKQELWKLQPQSLRVSLK